MRNRLVDWSPGKLYRHQEGGWRGEKLANQCKSVAINGPNTLFVYQFKCLPNVHWIIREMFPCASYLALSSPTGMKLEIWCSFCDIIKYLLELVPRNATNENNRFLFSPRFRFRIFFASCSFCSFFVCICSFSFAQYTYFPFFLWHFNRSKNT